MTLPNLYPAGNRAGRAARWPNHGQQKAPIIADRGGYSVRARERRQNASLALRITPNPNFGAIRCESFSK